MNYFERKRERQRRLKFEEQLPDALNTMANGIRAGYSLSQAFDSVIALGDDPISNEFTILQHQLKLGMNFEVALRSMDERIKSEDFTLVTSSILISRKMGGNITEIFDRISETIRARQKVARKIKTLTAQGRFQGMVVSAMPLFLGIIMTILKPDLMIPFFMSPVGWVLITLMLFLIISGWLIIKKIVTIDV